MAIDSVKPHRGLVKPPGHNRHDAVKDREERERRRGGKPPKDGTPKEGLVDERV